MKKPAREQVVNYLSGYLNVPPSQLSDNVALPDSEKVAHVCGAHFHVTLRVGDTHAFTVGELVSQMTA